MNSIERSISQHYLFFQSLRLHTADRSGKYLNIFEYIRISEYSPHYVLDPLHAPISCGLSATCKRPEQFLNHVTALISEHFVESWLDDSSFAKLGRSILQNAKAKALYLMVLYGILLYCRLFCMFYGIVTWYCMILRHTYRTVLYGFAGYCMIFL